MRRCPKCTELEDSLERLVVEYWGTVERNQQLPSTDPDKPDAQSMELTAKTTMDETWNVLKAHMKAAHSHIVGRD